MSGKEWTADVAPLAPGPNVPGWLRWFDAIMGQTSGGKDSQRSLAAAAAEVDACGVWDRFAALHLILDRADATEETQRIEWPQVAELAAEQAARYGLPLAAEGGWAVWNARARREQPASREVWARQMHYARRDFDGDLLDDFATRKRRDGTPRGFARIRMRYCTGEWKAAVARAFAEQVCRQIRAERGLRRPVRLLYIMGLRAQESTDRANRPVFGFNDGASAQTLRHVWTWLPIHHLTAQQVWDDIHAEGVPYHPVYDEGMPRLSCRFCVLSGRDGLSIAKRLAPHTATQYQAVEAAIGDSFQHNRPLSSIQPAPGPQGFAVRWTTCPTCGVRVLARDWETSRCCPAHAATGPWAGTTQDVNGMDPWTRIREGTQR